MQCNSTLVRWCVSAAAVMLAGGAFAETVRVSTVEALTNELDRLNRTRSTSHTVILEEGAYDVSGCAMLCDDASDDVTKTFRESRSHLAISHLTLKGASADPRKTVIYGNGTRRIFYCYSGTIQYVTISNGYASASETFLAGSSGSSAAKCGAGILARNESTSLKDSVVTCCSAPGGSGGGASTLAKAERCLFEYNSAQYGGAIASSHSGSGAAAREGVVDCVLRYNSASKSGGATENCYMRNTTIAFNTAGLFGGGAHNNIGRLYGCTVVSNTAGCGGGGVYISDNYYANISNSLVACNWADSSGGGIFGGGTAFAAQCIVSNNICAGNYTGSGGTWLGGGGGIGGNGLKVYDCEVVNNAVTNYSVTSSSAGHGGGISGDVFVTNTIIAGNYAAVNGGGAHKIRMVDCVISNNITGCYGGGVSKCAVTDSAIVFNQCKYEHVNRSGFAGMGGAGAYESYVTNSVVAGNAALPTHLFTESQGGAGNKTVFVGCGVSNNFGWVGAIMQGGSGERCVFRNNASGNGNYAVRGATGFVDCDFQGVILDSPGYLVNCRVHDYKLEGYATIPEGCNVATSGVFACMLSKDSKGYYSVELLTTMYGNTSIACTNTLFHDNQVRYLLCPSASKNSDGTYNLRHIPFVNCAFINNQAAGTCTALGITANSATFVNTMFYGNLSYDGTVAQEYWPDWSGDTNVVMQCCLLGPGATRYLPREMTDCKMGKTVKFERTPGVWPYTPAAQGVIHGGLVQDWMTGATDLRGVGYPRLRDGKVDIGCYQCWLNPEPTVLIVR